MRSNRVIGTTLAHSDFGDPECCGCLLASVSDQIAIVTCNECGAIIRSTRADQIDRILAEMELTLPVAAELCPYCGAANLMSGLVEAQAFVCQSCGRGVVKE